MSGVKKFLVLVLLLAIWGVFSTLTDGIAKTLFATWDFPVTLFLITLVVSTMALKVFFHFFNSVEPLQDSLALVGFWRAAPIAITQSLGFIFTYMSYSKVPVSFAQALKASDPFVNLVLAHFVFKSRASLTSWLTVVPIAAGVALLSSDNASFDLAGFFFAIASTVCFVLRSLLTANTLKPLGPLNAFYFITWVSMVLVAPVWTVVELPQLFALPNLVPDSVLGSVSPAFWDQAGPSTWVVDPSRLPSWVANTPAAALVSAPYVNMILLVALFHLVYNVVSFRVLIQTTPLVHSVCNVMRRVGLVIASILWFGTVPSTLAMLGMVSVFVGVLLFTALRPSASSATPATATAAAAAAATAAAVAAPVVVTRALTDEEEARPIRYTGLCSTGSRALLKAAQKTAAAAAAAQTGASADIPAVSLAEAEADSEAKAKTEAEAEAKAVAEAEDEAKSGSGGADAEGERKESRDASPARVRVKSTRSARARAAGPAETSGLDDAEPEQELEQRALRRRVRQRG